jgi:hypothetical protein
VRLATRLASLGAAAVLTLALVLVAATPARADGDPASDVLLGLNVFYPYSPPVSQTLQNTLNGETAAASRAHFPIKVALIESPLDLGAIPVLFDKPQQYADFLDDEISFGHRQLLLVVMPDGYGVQGVSAATAAAVASLARPAGRQSDDLARAAITAVQTLAAAAGHPIAVSQSPSTGGGGGPGSTPLALIVLALAAIVLAGALIALRVRERPPGSGRASAADRRAAGGRGAARGRAPAGGRRAAAGRAPTGGPTLANGRAPARTRAMRDGRSRSRPRRPAAPRRSSTALYTFAYGARAGVIQPRLVVGVVLISGGLFWAVARGLNFYGLSLAGVGYDVDQPPLLLLLVGAWLVYRSGRP